MALLLCVLLLFFYLFLVCAEWIGMITTKKSLANFPMNESFQTHLIIIEKALTKQTSWVSEIWTILLWGVLWNCFYLVRRTFLAAAMPNGMRIFLPLCLQVSAFPVLKTWQICGLHSWDDLTVEHFDEICSRQHGLIRSTAEFTFSHNTCTSLSHAWYMLSKRSCAF